MPVAKKPSPKTAAKSDAKDPDLDLIARLADILNATGLTEIELDRKGTKVRVSKTLTAVATISSAPQSAPVFHGHGHASSSGAMSTEAPSPVKTNGEHPGTVKSPMVGTVYLAPTPGAPNFVDIGSLVKEGQTVLIIEAMKTMNQIQAPRSGKVTQIFVDNGTPVEYGEPLVAIE